MYRFPFYLLLTALILMTTNGTAPAQDMPVVVGIKGGLNASKIYGDGQPVALGFHAGLFSQVHFQKNLAVQAELLYSTKGVSMTDSNSAALKSRINYIDLPIFLVLDFAGVGEVQMGGYASYLLQARSTSPDNVSAIQPRDEEFNRLDAGLLAGIVLDVGKLQLGVRYNFSLRELASSKHLLTGFGESKIITTQIFVAWPFNR